MAKTTLLDQMTKSLNKMEDTGKVDILILNDLKKLEKKLLEIEEKWLKSGHKDSFFFYQGVRNVELILERMMERFEKSLEENDNPQIAKDTLALIPLVSDLIQLTGREKLDSSSVNQILERTRQLRNKAAETNLIEVEEKNKRLVENKKLSKSFDEILKTIDIPNELPNDVQIDEDEED